MTNSAGASSVAIPATSGDAAVATGLLSPKLGVGTGFVSSVLNTFVPAPTPPKPPTKNEGK